MKTNKNICHMLSLIKMPSADIVTSHGVINMCKDTQYSMVSEGLQLEFCQHQAEVTCKSAAVGFVCASC